VGGNFTIAGGITVNRIARWNGQQWSKLGNGVNEKVSAMAVRGNEVFIGGEFTGTGNNSVPLAHIARWDGTRWYSLGLGITGNVVKTIYVDGSDVYVGGKFSGAGGQSAGNAAVWRNNSWHPLGSGTNDEVECFIRRGDAILVGGWFTEVGGHVSPRFAHWTKLNTTPVYFHDFTARSLGGAVELSWDVSYDEPITGFRIYRAAAAGPELPLNTQGLIPTEARGYADDTAEFGQSYRYILSAVRPDGSEMRSPAVNVTTPTLRVSLEQNHPNPFNPITTIQFVLADAGPTTLTIYDAAGQRVQQLLDGVMPAGPGSVTWNGLREDGSRASSGVYFYRLESGIVRATKKMILLK
jgi:hypothetical protein